MAVSTADMKEVIKKRGLDVDVNILRDDAPLKEQGVDSLIKMEILLVIEETFKRKIPDEDADRLHTMNDLAAYVNDAPGR